MHESPRQDAAANTPTWSDHVTDYDRAHLLLYAQLLDGVATGRSDAEMISALLELTPGTDAAASSLAQHLDRARWMRETGYAQILSGESQGPFSCRR